MAKNNTQETRTAIDDINDQLTKAEMKVQDNKKLIMWAVVAVAVIVVLVLLYLYAYLKPSKNAADNALGLANNKEAVYNINSQQLDSAANATELAAITKAYEEVAAKHGHDGGNNATLMAAIYNYKQGDYQKALNYLSDYDGKDVIIAAMSKALEGDCYVNLDKLDDALAAFKKAEKLGASNPEVAPYCLLKQATVLRAQKKYAEEAEVYSTLISTYPEYAVAVGANFETLRERALLQADKK